MFQRHSAFYEHKFGLHHELIPASLLDIAEAFRQMGRGCDERLPLLDRAVANLDLSIGREKNRNEAGLSTALRKAAECCEEAGHLAGAELRWAKCVVAATKVSGCRGLLCTIFMFNYKGTSLAAAFMAIDAPLNISSNSLSVQAYGADHARTRHGASSLEAVRRKLAGPGAPSGS